MYWSGWEMGAVEAISLSILVGSSVDYCVHLVEGYLLAGENLPLHLAEVSQRPCREHAGRAQVAERVQTQWENPMESPPLGIIHKLLSWNSSVSETKVFHLTLMCCVFLCAGRCSDLHSCSMKWSSVEKASCRWILLTVTCCIPHFSECLGAEHCIESVQNPGDSAGGQKVFQGGLSSSKTNLQLQ